MSLASDAIRRGWVRLPEEVLLYKPMTTNGYPTVRVKRTLFTKIFDRSLTNYVMHANRPVDSAIEQSIIAAIAAATPSLRLVRAWHEALVSAHKAHVTAGGVPLGTDGVEKLFTRSWTEAAAAPTADTEEMADRARQLITEMADTAGLSRAHVALALDDEAVVVDAHRLMDSAPVWEREALLASTPAELDAVRALAFELLRHARAAGGTTFVTEGTAGHWGELREHKALPVVPRPHSLGLITGGVPAPLTFWPANGDWDGECESTLPLDQSIVERLLGLYQNQSFVPVAEDAAALITQVVESAASPLGLSSTSSLATMVLAQFAASGLTMSVAVDGNRTRVARELAEDSELAGAIQIFSRQWNSERHVRQELGRPGTYPRPVVDFMESPETYYFVRLWKRVHAAQFSLAPIDSFNDSWAHLHGALKSTIGEISHRIAQQPAPIGSLDDNEDGRREFIVEAVEPESLAFALVTEICACGAQDSAAEVRALLKWAKTRPTRREPSGWIRYEIEWDLWCRQFLELKPNAFDRRTGEIVPRTLDDLPSIDIAVTQLWRELDDE